MCFPWLRDVCPLSATTKNEELHIEMYFCANTNIHFSIVEPHIYSMKNMNENKLLDAKIASLRMRQN